VIKGSMPAGPQLHEYVLAEAGEQPGVFCFPGYRITSTPFPSHRSSARQTPHVIPWECLITPPPTKATNNHKHEPRKDDSGK
jgi:hypothetical protein